MTLENFKNQPLVEAIFENLISELQTLYSFSKPREVIKYLTKNQNMLDILLKAHKKIREIFTYEPLVLRVSFDAEIMGWQRLLIVVYTNLDADEAFDKLKLFENNWWLDAAYEVGNDLDIHIEFNEV